MVDLSEHVTGPTGGIVAASFGSGCVAGWAFAQRVVVKIAGERLDEANDRIERLEAKIEMLEGEYKTLMNRQAEQ